MHKFEYKELKDGSLSVVVNNIVSGQIRKVRDGFQYYPRNCKTGGKVYSNLLQVKISLECDTDDED